MIAHIRAKSTEDGLARVKTNAMAYGLWTSAWKSISRLEVVVGDIAMPQLGLSQSLWNRLISEVDVVVHNGALVNWMLPYSRLHPANVLSTLACVQLCAAGKPKRIAFVSSTSTLDNEHYVRLSQDMKISVLETDDLEGSRKGLVTGYGQSKWASECIVREAGRRGLMGAIIRPGYITGDPKSGISITDDFLVRLWKGCLQAGMRPDIPNTLNAVPVAQVSRIVVAAVFHLPDVLGEPMGVAQVTSHPRLTLNEWMAALEVYGYPVPIVPYQAWCRRIKEYVDDDTEEDDHALLPLFHYVTGDLPANTIAPELDDTNAEKALQSYQKHVQSHGQPLAESALSTEILGKYLAYLVAIDFLPAPAKTGKCELPGIEGTRDQTLAANHLGGRSARP